jgi:RNA polymerase sigma-70 factor (ECF subfamily)
MRLVRWSFMVLSCSVVVVVRDGASRRRAAETARHRTALPSIRENHRRTDYPPHVAGNRTNEEWLADLREDEPAALEALRAFLARGLRSVLDRRAGAGDEDVEDLAQDALLRILERLGSFRGDSRFTTWAMSVAVRLSLTTLRRRHWQDVSLDGLELPPRETPASEEPAATAERADLVDALRDAIENDLTERQRTVIRAEMVGVPGVRLGQELGTNPNALYKLYHDARKKLKKGLLERGFDEDQVRSIAEAAS